MDSFATYARIAVPFALWNFLLFFNLQTKKNSSGKMRKLYAYVANEFTRRLVEDRMSTGLTNTRTALGFFVLYHVFARKRCILCSALRHKIYLIYLLLHRFEIHFVLELSRTALLGCCLAASRLRKAAHWQEESFNSVQVFSFLY